MVNSRRDSFEFCDVEMSCILPVYLLAELNREVYRAKGSIDVWYNYVKKTLQRCFTKLCFVCLTRLIHSIKTRVCHFQMIQQYISVNQT